MENAQLAYESAKNSWMSAKKKLQQIEQQADWTLAGQQAQAVQQGRASQHNQVKALSAGKVLRMIKRVGDFVRKGDVIAVLASDQHLLAQLNVDENSIKKIREGQRTHVQLNVDKGKVLEGLVSTIYPLYDETTQSFLCDVSFEKPLDFQVVGTRLEANIDVASRKQVLLIPRAYLSYSNTVQVKGEEEPRNVEAGIRSTEWVEIKNGLTEQDILIPLKK
jgi:multidrug resistance efflux pump